MYTPKEELVNRVKKLQQLMVKHNIEGAIITQNADLFYFAGTIQSSHLYIPLEGKPLLMTRRSFERAQIESMLEKIVPLQSVKTLKEQIKSEGYEYPQILGMELDVLPANNYLFYEKVLAPAKLVDISPLIKEVRMIKSPYEIGKIKEAAKLIDEVYEEIPNLLKAGMKEIELSAEMERMARAKGHQGLVRMRAYNQEIYFGQLLSGASGGIASFFDGPVGGQGLSSAHPQNSSYKIIERGEPILIDYSGIKEGYIVDLTRMFAIGSMPEKFLQAFDISVEIQNKILDFIKVGKTTCAEVYEYSLALAKETPFYDNYMGYKSTQVKFVGHGVGIELDEAPVLARGFNQVIVPGMVLAIEPKFVFPQEGGVGIENTWFVRDKDLEKITSRSDELVIVG